VLKLQSRPRIGFSVLVAILSVSRAASTQAEEGQGFSGGSGTRLQLHPRGLNGIVGMAVIEAHRRLENAECREVFSDFEDASGHTLQETLDSLGQTGQSYLGWIWFRDGGFQGLCARSDVLAITAPGSRVVSYCGERFTRAILRQGPRSLAMTILHEELHSLGLGEDPPTSLEITRRVETRCGS